MADFHAQLASLESQRRQDRASLRERDDSLAAAEAKHAAILKELAAAQSDLRAKDAENARLTLDLAGTRQQRDAKAQEVARMSAERTQLAQVYATDRQQLQKERQNMADSMITINEKLREWQKVDLWANNAQKAIEGVELTLRRVLGARAELDGNAVEEVVDKVLDDIAAAL